MPACASWAATTWPAAANRGGLRPGLLEEMEAALAPWQDAAGLAFPTEALLVGARR